MFKIYCTKLFFRFLIFLIALYAYFIKPSLLDPVFAKGFSYDTLWVYLVWAILMGSLVIHMLPDNHSLTMGSKKRFVENFDPVENYDRIALYEYVQKNNVSAIWVLIVWLSFNAIFGLLYLQHIIAAKELILLSIFFYLSDLICVVVWCPFQSFIIKNKCCVSCRIFNWGHFMMFTPMLFIVNFLTWSLFFTALIVMLRWELTLLRHPERFWEQSNKNLQCSHCKEQICKFKGKK